MSQSPLERAAARLAAADKILLTCHPRPDGDSAGSMIALASLLRAEGKSATLYSPLRVPRYLHWLPLRETWVHQLRAASRYDVTCVLDCGEEKLLGPSFPKPEVTGDIIVFDHHAHGVPFGDIYVLDGAASATSVLVARLAKLLGWEVSVDAAVGIYVALISDTGGFRYANTNAEAFALAGELVGAGLVNPGEIVEKLSTLYTGARLRLIAKVLDSVKRELGGRVAVMVVTDETLSSAGASWDDTDGLIHYVRNLRGARCGVFISPAKGGGIRVSMRSRPDGIDVGSVCAMLGGGGHIGAAGATLEGDLEAARVRVLEALSAAFDAETAATRETAVASAASAAEETT